MVTARLSPSDGSLRVICVASTREIPESSAEGITDFSSVIGQYSHTKLRDRQLAPVLSGLSCVNLNAHLAIP